jgi:hypothetical protein
MKKKRRAVKVVNIFINVPAGPTKEQQAEDMAKYALYQLRRRLFG